MVSVLIRGITKLPMSRRWFILAFSIIFLFVFRIWINDMGINESNYTVQNTSQTGNIKVETFTPPTYHAMGSFNLVSKSWLENSILKRDINEYLYIFPAWPDTLGYSYEQVFVNHDMIEKNSPYGVLINVD